MTATIIDFPRRAVAASASPPMTTARLNQIIAAAFPPLPKLPGDEVMAEIHRVMAPYLAQMRRIDELMKGHLNVWA